MIFPNEIMDQIFINCQSADIIRWKDLKCMREITYLRKKDDNLFNAIISENMTGVEYLLQTGHLPCSEAVRWSILIKNTKILKLLLDYGGGGCFGNVLLELALLFEQFN